MRSLATIVKGVPSATRIASPQYIIPQVRAYATSGPSNPRDDADDFYALLLANPIPTSAPKSIEPRELADRSEGQRSDSRILFSAPLSGPSARLRGLMHGEQGLAKPSEPDNCCMSGCVNCVWDTYREEMEQWVAGRRKREAERHGKMTYGQKMSAAVSDSAVNGDEDGMGNSKTYDAADINNDDDVFQDIPVGIREFMKQEKRLQERRAQERLQ